MLHFRQKCDAIFNNFIVQQKIVLNYIWFSINCQQLFDVLIHVTKINIIRSILQIWYNKNKKLIFMLDQVVTSYIICHIENFVSLFVARANELLYVITCMKFFSSHRVDDDDTYCIQLKHFVIQISRHSAIDIFWSNQSFEQISN